MRQRFPGFRCRIRKNLPGNRFREQYKSGGCRLYPASAVENLETSAGALSEVEIDAQTDGQSVVIVYRVLEVAVYKC